MCSRVCCCIHSGSGDGSHTRWSIQNQVVFSFVILIVAILSALFFQFYGNSQTNASLGCTEGCDEPWTWVYYDFIVLLKIISITFAVASFLDFIAQSCEVYHRHHQRRKLLKHINNSKEQRKRRKDQVKIARQMLSKSKHRHHHHHYQFDDVDDSSSSSSSNSSMSESEIYAAAADDDDDTMKNNEINLSEQQATRNCCYRMKDRLHKNCCCVVKNHHSDTQITWWTRILLCIGQTLYTILFVLHTRHAKSNTSSINDVNVMSFAYMDVTSLWPYYIYLPIDIFFFIWISVQIFSLRGHRSYNKELLSSVPFVCGWIGTFSSLIMCCRRLLVQQETDFTPPISFAILRIAYVEKLFLTFLLDTGPRSFFHFQDNLKKQMIKTLLGTFTFLFLAATSFYITEGLGDPPTLRKFLVIVIFSIFLEIFKILKRQISPLFLNIFFILKGTAFRSNGDWIGEWHIFSAMYWSVVTMTTVGFGDMYPSTVYGKALAMCVIIVGIQFLSQVKN
jgi:hypothetical protein